MERLVKGDIIVINFPYSDLITYKKRPALIVKVPNGEEIIVCQITSSSSEKSVEISLQDQDFQHGKLKINSYIRIDKIFSIEKSLIDYKIGSLKHEKFKEIIEKFVYFLKN
ncbi:type II toxin-antitoxin system PemK/MazF family toxin [Candidatus Pacearchaeota archaeon]|nr:type II toxin-antitoxin system PemK/MazF family toxin [Candidatus Pacearchaeota archaeon]